MTVWERWESAAINRKIIALPVAQGKSIAGQFSFKIQNRHRSILKWLPINRTHCIMLFTCRGRFWKMVHRLYRNACIEMQGEESSRKINRNSQFLKFENLATKRWFEKHFLTSSNWNIVNQIMQKFLHKIAQLIDFFVIFWEQHKNAIFQIDKWLIWAGFVFAKLKFM